LDLPAYENDILHALTRSGGLPGSDSNDTVVIQRAQTAAAGPSASPQQIRIPMHVREGQPPPFKPEDVVLQNGDLVLVEARGTERSQTGSAEVEPSRFGGAPPTMSLAVTMPDGRVLVQMSAAPAATPTAAATGQWQTFGASQFQAFETDG